MAGITLAQAEAQLALWLAASTAIAERGQKYTIGDRTLDRANLGEIKSMITYWDEKVSKLSAAATGRRGPRYAVTE